MDKVKASTVKIEKEDKAEEKEKVSAANNSNKNKDLTTGKKELVELIREKTGLNKDQSQKAVEAVLEGIRESLRKGEEVKLIGFGSFSVQLSAARKGINPKTKEPIDIAASNRATFKAGKELKKALNPTKK